MRSYINFEKNITPAIMKTLYLAGTIYYIYNTISNIPWDYIGDIPFGLMWRGLLFWVSGLIAIRMACEFFLVLFNALSNLANKEKLPLDIVD